MGHSNKYLTYIRAPEWYAKSKKCQSLTRHHCVLFPWLKSRHCHHLTYRNLTKEVPLCDTVPLSKSAHQLIHLPLFWKTFLRPSVNWLLRLSMALWVIVYWVVR